MHLRLDLSNELAVNNETNKLTIITDPNGTCEKLSDGLYANAEPGTSTVISSGFEGTYNSEGIRLGYADAYNMNRTPGCVVGTNIIHRTFDASSDDGKNLIGFRPEIDVVLPGDFYRVKQSDNRYKYYLVTDTSYQDSGTGNEVIASAYLGTW